MKTVTVFGKASDGKLPTKRLRRRDLNIDNGKWLISISNVSIKYLSNVENPSCISIGCNLVNERQWVGIDKLNYEKGPFERITPTPLASFALEKKQNTSSVHHHNLSLHWFEITCIKESFEVTLTDLFYEIPFSNSDILFSIQFCFKNV